MNPFTALLARDMRLAVRVGGGALMGALFFLIVVTMMPFAIGPDLALLARIGPAIFGSARCWRVCSRSIVCSRPTMTTDRSIFLMMGEMPLELAVAAKAIAHWLTTGLPLVVVAPLLGLMLNVELHALGWLALTLGCRHASPDIHRADRRRAVGGAAARRIAARRAGAAAHRAGADLRRRRGQCRNRRPRAVRPPFTILCALSLASLVLGPIAAAAALRHGLE